MKTYLTLAVIVLFSSCKQGETSTPSDLEAQSLALHKKVLTVDTHVDINVRNFTDSINYTQDLDTQVNLPKMKAGGLDVAWFIVYTGQDSLTTTGYEKAAQNATAKFEAIHRLCDSIAPESIGLARTPAEARALDKQGKLVAMIGIENAYPLGEDIGLIQDYYDMGARYISLAHNGHSQFSDSNTGEADNIWLHNGLSELGEQAVNEMNRVGIMIDISHPSKEAIKQMLALSQAPIIASHSSARALCDHSRNLDDELLLLLKENGGVVQTVAFKSYLNKEKSEARNNYLKEIRSKIADSLGIKLVERSQFRSLSPDEQTAFIANYRKVNRLADEMAENDPQAPAPVDVSDFVDHIDYLVEKIGIDHVGISSDFDGGGGIKGWSDASETFNVTRELVKRGYSEAEIQKLWGENLFRVMDEVAAVAASMQ